MEVQLSDDEVRELSLLLDGALGELSEEIAGTDNARYRATLRDRRQHLVTIRQKLSR